MQSWNSLYIGERFLHLQVFEVVGLLVRGAGSFFWLSLLVLLFVCLYTSCICCSFYLFPFWFINKKKVLVSKIVRQLNQTPMVIKKANGLKDLVRSCWMGYVKKTSKKGTMRCKKMLQQEKLMSQNKSNLGLRRESSSMSQKKKKKKQKQNLGLQGERSSFLLKNLKLEVWIQTSSTSGQHWKRLCCDIIKEKYWDRKKPC